MIATNEIQSWIDQHSQATPQSAAWLKTQQSAAIKRFEKSGLPNIRDEQWRYTDLRQLKSKALKLNTSDTVKTALEVSIAESSIPRLVFVDGHLNSEVSTALDNPGIHCSSLAQLLKDQDSSIEEYFGSTLEHASKTENNGFTSLNTAFAQDGYVINLEAGVVLEQALEIIFVSQSNDSVHHLRNLIIARPNSQATIVERHIGAQNCVYLNNAVTEIIAQDNANIDHYKIQQESASGFHMGGVFIKQGNGSQVKNHNIALNGLVTRNDIYCDLMGGGAHVEMNGLVLGKGRQHVDNHTEVNHAVAHCTSDEYYKTILDDNSRSVFRGRIIVAQDAQQTLADQQNNNLLLSDHAEADCKPQLEIYADDVKCSHGATVGQLDKASMFYLQSRGINSTSAQALLTFAFANEVLDRLQVESIKSELRQLIAGELLEGLENLI